MTPAERQRRKRRLERAGLAALPTGWVSAAFAARAAAQVEAYQDKVEEALTVDPPRGRPPKQPE